VGTWEYITLPVPSEDGERRFTTFNADGTYQVKTPRGLGEGLPGLYVGGERKSKWWVQDGELVQFAYLGGTGFSELKAYVWARFLRERVGFAIQVQFEIAELTASSLKLRSSDGRIHEYRRVEE
jgi:hypothetical protein